MYEIIFSEESKDDLFNIESYIAQDNKYIAEKVINSILNTIQYLSIFPELWPLKNVKYREIVETVYKYQIRYKLESNFIYIMTIYKYQNK